MSDLTTQLRDDSLANLADISGADDSAGISEAFSKFEITDWINKGHQWNSVPDCQDRSNDRYGSTRSYPNFPMQNGLPTSFGGFPRAGPRNSISSLSSGVQSPPGFDAPPTMVGHGAGGGMTSSGNGYYSSMGASNGRSTPCSLSSASGPSHFKFPSLGQGSLRMLPSQRLGLTPSPIGMTPRHRQPRPQYNFCVFCKNNGEDEKFYMTHTLKDDNGLVRCPVLCNYVCPICAATGKVAHTIRYCPKNKDDRYHDNYAPITMLKEMRSSTGKPRVPEGVESMFFPDTESTHGGPPPPLLRPPRAVLGQPPPRMAAGSPFDYQGNSRY